MWPLLLADVNNEARHPALAIGGITACGYLGMVAGPPLVGMLSALFGLQVGLLVLAGDRASGRDRPRPRPHPGSRGHVKQRRDSRVEKRAYKGD